MMSLLSSRYMMHHVMGQAMSEDEVDDLLKEADIDGDGQLNYEGKCTGISVMAEWLEQASQ